jgi:hypothetical protein
MTMIELLLDGGLSAEASHCLDCSVVSISDDPLSMWGVDFPQTATSRQRLVLRLLDECPTLLAGRWNFSYYEL